MNYYFYVVVGICFKMNVSTTTATYISDREAVPTWRPKRENCTPPAIEQFPPPLMSKWVRRHGGLIIHILVAIFTFFGLAIVCDEYFVASLDRLCEGGQFLKNEYYKLYLNQISVLIFRCKN